MRRTVDIILAVVAGIVLLPLFGVITVLILSAMGRPVLFRQTRPGRDRIPFGVVKFRTMRAPSFEGESDHDRTPRLGAFLRASSLDELPQLWNILRGHMSFIGPRPLPLRPAASYTPDELMRLRIRPGLTGWAQVNGRNSISPQERTELDLWYVYNRSLGLDLKILALTVVRVVRAQGIYGPLDPQRPPATTPRTGDTGVAQIAEVMTALPDRRGMQHDIA